MAVRCVSFAFIFLLAFAVILPVIRGGEKSGSGIVDFDEFLRNKADKSLDAAVEAYEPNPEKVTEDFNKQVGAELVGEHVHKHGNAKQASPSSKKH